MKRVTIGRSISASRLDELDKYSQQFTLASGKVVTFRLVRIDAQDVREKTYVVFENNGRDQLALTEESLQDITETIRFQQFYPAIGWKNDRGIEILDGSRRRAAALIANVGLNILVTDEEISVSDARQLAKAIQTAKEHNIREQGLMFLKMRESGLTQKQIAVAESISEAKVSRAIQAAAVPLELLELFPVWAELGFADYKSLLGLVDKLKNTGRDLAALIDAVKKKLSAEQISNLPVDEQKERIMEILKGTTTAVLNVPGKERVVTEKLWNFDNKDQFARKKRKDRSFIYEFGRLSKELQDELDSVISETLKKHLS